LGLQLQDQARDQLNNHLEGFRAQLGLQLQDQARDQLNSHLDGFRALLGLQLQDQLRDQINDHLEGSGPSWACNCKTRHATSSTATWRGSGRCSVSSSRTSCATRSTITSRGSGRCSASSSGPAARPDQRPSGRLPVPAPGPCRDTVADRLSPRLGSVDAEVASLRDTTAETGSLTGALRDDVASLQSDIVELTRMLRMQADAADQVAEALGRTLIRLSVEVEDLNAALGGSPARGAELWPALSAEEEAQEAQEEARVVSLGLWGDRTGGWPAGSEGVQAEGAGTGRGEPRRRLPRRVRDKPGDGAPEPAPASGTAGPGHRKATRRSGARSRAGVEGNGARVPVVDEAPSPE